MASTPYAYTDEGNVLHRFISAGFGSTTLLGIVGGMLYDTIEEGRCFNDGHKTVRARPVYVEDSEVRLGIQDPTSRQSPTHAAAALSLQFRDGSGAGTPTITLGLYVPRGCDMPLDYSDRGAVLTQSYKLMDTTFGWTIAA